MADYSGTITSGTNAQTAAAADVSRNTLMLQNPGVTEMYYAFGTTAVQASPSILLSAGDTHFWPVGFRDLICRSISIIGPTTSSAFTIFDAKV